jgi:hypothetical protein
LEEDVQPYICLSEDCRCPLLFFTNMEQWRHHMNTFHSNQWTRRVHRSTWFCDTDHEATQFNDLEIFLEHMKDPDNHPGGDPPTSQQLDTLCRIRQEFLIRDDECSCPFCDCIPDMLKLMIPNGDPKEILYQLHKHVAIHLKDLAILSVPILDAIDAPQDISDASKPEKRRHRLKDGEEASYPSGYDQELRDIPLPNDDPEVRPPLEVKETPTTHWVDTGFTQWYEKEHGGKSSKPKNDPILKAFAPALSQSSETYVPWHEMNSSPYIWPVTLKSGQGMLFPTFEDAAQVEEEERTGRRRGPFQGPYGEPIG